MGIGNRQSQHSFAQVPDVKMARSQFDRSFALKDTHYFDHLNPIMVQEILPGDTINLTVNTFARLATQKVPIMDNLYIDFFFFFVPNRLVWDNWEKFNGAQDDPADSTSFIMPKITAQAGAGFEVGSIYDKMGLPTGIASLVVNNCLPLRAYNLIWNEWFRDQNLQDSLVVDKDDGPDTFGNYQLRKRCKYSDYFTRALPWPQKGPAVQFPLGTSAPVKGIGKLDASYSGTPVDVWESGEAAQSTYVTNQLIGTASDNNKFYVERDLVDPNQPHIYADLTLAASATINQLREAFSIQAMYELDARGGTRYVEILQAHFNVISPDFRLQRPEYLGGGQTRINSHPVAQTAPTAGANAQGQLAAFATQSSTGEIGFTKSFVEHGYVIGLSCARADITYQQGLDRMWNRETRFDFFWPKLQELGEQEILNKEIYAQQTADDELVFGYQERYAEYRYNPSRIQGEFRSTFTTPLDMWHMAEEFTALPELNDVFIESATPIERAITVTGAPHLLFDAYFNMKHARPIMAYGAPVTLGRF